MSATVVVALFRGLRLVFTAVAVLASQPAEAAEPAAPVNSPLSAKDSLKYFRVAAGLKVELVAAEPAVVDPVSIAFDEDGRMYVAEMRDYPTGPAEGAPGMSQIKLLEDRDGDGYYETSHVFAENLLFANGVEPWRGGVIVTLAGEVAWFKDNDGDGRADLRETWFNGFAEQNSQLRANHPRFALDSHIYVANGLRGGTVVADEKKWRQAYPEVSLAGRDLRFNPLTGECESIAGNGQFGLSFDDWGNRFLCDNRHPCRHVVLEDRYTKRNRFLAVREVCEDVCASAEKSRVYPISQAWTTSTQHAGQFTAACGVLFYRGHALPEACFGNIFACEPTGSLVHREAIINDAANLSTFHSRAVDGEAEFLSSPDGWFRPVDLAHGPDGALYVVDMYRAVIEHPEFVPAELKNRPDTWCGNDRGRIYRVVRDDAAPHRKLPPLSRATPHELVSLLADRNHWVRETAARLLYERQDRSLVGEIEKRARTASQPAARVRALWLLAGLGSLSDELLDEASADPVDEVRRQAFILAEPRLKGRDPSSPLVQNLLTFDEPARPVHFQQVLTLGELPASSAKQAALARAAFLGAGDRWFRLAAVSSAGDAPQQLFCSIVEADGFQKLPQQATQVLMLRDLAELIGARRNPDEVVLVLQQLVSRIAASASERSAAAERLVLAVWNGLAQGLARRGDSLADVVARLQKRDSHISRLSQAVSDSAIALAHDATVPLDLRLEAVAALQHVGYSAAGASLKGLATTAEPALRLRAIESLAGYREPQATDALLAGFSNQTPAMRRVILQLMLSDVDRTRRLLQEIAADRLPARELDSLSVQALLRHKDDAIRKKAQRLLAALVPADRGEVLAKYQRALTLDADPRRGQPLFEKNCATCHRIGTVGVDVAPDIADSRTKTPAQLLNDILNPNGAIDGNYVSYTVVTTDGKSETGVISAETPVSITLRQPEGKTLQILRADIDELRSNGVSLMPEGLEKNLSVEEIADLISFIKNWRYLDGAVPLK